MHRRTVKPLDLRGGGLGLILFYFHLTVPCREINARPPTTILLRQGSRPPFPLPKPHAELQSNILVGNYALF